MAGSKTSRDADVRHSTPCNELAQAGLQDGQIVREKSLPYEKKSREVAVVDAFMNLPVTPSQHLPTHHHDTLSIPCSASAAELTPLRVYAQKLAFKVLFY